MMAESTPELLPFNGRSIPQVLKDQPRWAPWVAVFNEKRGKFDKIPRRADTPEYGLSTADPSRWFTYKAAVTAYEREKPSLAGVGYVMTKAHGVVGTDLDDCIVDGVVAPWAQEVVDLLDSYAEVSPSGKGLRIFSLGAVDDWTNHTVGIEVYGGSAPRFLTLTGEHLAHTPLGVNALPAGAMDCLRGQYASAVRKADVQALDMPDLVDELVMPDWEALDLPYAVRDFLSSGEHGGDRSRELHAAAVALYQAGLADDEVLTVLAHNPHTMEVALDHRGQDSDRALAYLWKEHGLKAKSKGERKVALAEDFEDVSESNAPKTLDGKAQEAINLGTKKPLRFAFQQAAEFSQAKPLNYFVKGLLPQAEVCAVFGASGSGKTFFALDLLLAVATGMEWRGRRVRQGAVGYICAEGASGFRTRLKAYAEFHGFDLTGIPMYVLGDAPNFLERGDIRDLLAAIRELPEMPAIICVDTWAQVTAGGNENSGEDMGRALAHCKALHKACSATVVLVAHTGKDADRGMRGWSGIKGALDAEIVVERSDQYRSATVTKMKDGTGEGDEFAFSLESVTVGQDEDGDDITSCVVKAGDHVPKAQRKAAPKGVWQQVVMRLATGMTDLADGVTTPDLIEAAINEMPKEDGKKDRRRERLLAALESLVAAGQLSTAGGLVVVL